MTTLVTGSAGFIGFHLARRLLERGDEVVGLDDLNAYYDPALKAARLAILEEHPGYRHAKLDLADREAMPRPLRRDEARRGGQPRRPGRRPLQPGEPARPTWTPTSSAS